MQRPRGTRDLYGKELKRIRKVRQVLTGNFEKYGYSEVETPIFEELELFTQKSGSEVMDQIYHFEDKSQRNLALRPELTAPAIRLYNNSLKRKSKPLKLFYWGPCFRYERPQSDRWRQFLQAGVELIGSSRPESDAEVIALTEDALDDLGLEEYSLEIGNIGLLRLLLEEGDVSRSDQDPILRAIDSEEDERIENELNEYDVYGETREILLDLIELSGGPSLLDEAGSLLSEVDGANKIIDNFDDILDKLKIMGVDFSLDLGIARGLEYYTGTVFEVYCEDVQIGGGGRYDGLIEALGGESTPAVGVGLGIDRIANFLKRQSKMEVGEGIDLIVLPTDESMLSKSLEIVVDLRDSGFIVDMDLRGRSLGKSLGYADSRNADYSVIVGPEDISEDMATVRDMDTGDQNKVELDGLSAELESLLNDEKDLTC